MAIKEAISLGKETYSRWSEHQAPRLGASVAFYSILSFAPLLVLITAVIALAFGHASAQGALVNEARQLIGDRGADTVNTLLKNAQKPASGIFATIIAFITLLFGASGVFSELRDALNIMWDAPKDTTSGFMAIVKQRLFSFGMVLSVGFLLLVSLLLSTALAFLGRGFGHLVPLPPFVLESINFVVSFAAVTVLFALMFKYVPAVKVPWRDVIVGAIGTALLFVVGKFLLGIYLGKAGVGSTYGAAGSLVAVVVWIYYSAQIFFFGAEFTRVYADAHKEQSAPAGHGSQPPQTQPAVANASAPERSPQLAPAPPRAAAAAAAGGYGSLPQLAPDQQRSAAPPERRPAAVPTSAVVTRAVAATPAVTRTAFPRQTKPRLLMALGLGFILGRLTFALRSTRIRH